MTINVWMNSTSNIPVPEQDILQDLTDDNIQAGGNDIVYILRDRINPDYLFGETPISEFKEGVVIEMMANNRFNFNGDGDLLSKFGVEHADKVTWVVSARRFPAVFQLPYGLTVPRSGDLIYDPIADELWEIRYVKKDKWFYQFGKNYSHRLECSLFTYSHEKVDVEGVPDVNQQYTVDLSFQDEDPAEDDIMRQTLGISPSKVTENNTELNNESKGVMSFDPQNPFGGTP